MRGAMRSAAAQTRPLRPRQLHQPAWPTLGGPARPHRRWLRPCQQGRWQKRLPERGRQRQQQQRRSWAARSLHSTREGPRSHRRSRHHQGSPLQLHRLQSQAPMHRRPHQQAEQQTQRQQRPRKSPQGKRRALVRLPAPARAGGGLETRRHAPGCRRTATTAAQPTAMRQQATAAQRQGQPRRSLAAQATVTALPTAARSRLKLRARRPAIWQRQACAHQRQSPQPRPGASGAESVTRAAQHRHPPPDPLRRRCPTACARAQRLLKSAQPNANGCGG